MAEGTSNYNELTPPHQNPVEQGIPGLEQPRTLEIITNLTETPKPGGTLLEQAIIQATPEAEEAPSWLNETVNKITDAWFDPKSFESEELYESLGVKSIKKYMPTGGDAVLNLLRKAHILKGGMVQKDLDSLKNMEHFTRIYEMPLRKLCNDEWLFMIMFMGPSAQLVIQAHQEAARIHSTTAAAMSWYPFITPQYPNHQSRGRAALAICLC